MENHYNRHMNQTYYEKINVCVNIDLSEFGVGKLEKAAVKLFFVWFLKLGKTWKRKDVSLPLLSPKYPTTSNIKPFFSLV